MPVVQTDGGADGRTDGRSGGRAVYGHVIGKFSRMGSLPHSLTHGALLCALRAGELRYKKKNQLCIPYLNGYFINVRQDLAAQLPIHNVSPTSFIRRRLLNSFVFGDIYNHEVQNAVMELKEDKSFIGIPLIFIK